MFATELAWREFYADVLSRQPRSGWENLDRRMDAMPVDTGRDARRRFEAWQRGETGYPIVDAGMRQLLATGWMHNRVRMVVASFLVKDLHLPWQWGARHFMVHLVDGDLASNSHGWQWTAGTGTDAAPYFRIFNPVTQSSGSTPRARTSVAGCPSSPTSTATMSMRRGTPARDPARVPPSDGRPPGGAGRGAAPLRARQRTGRCADLLGSLYPSGVTMLDERKSKILRAIVREYIETAQPVGSSHVAADATLKVSPATIRNEMAVLEQEGYLRQPYTSAGRVPTDKAYRVYVDQIAQPGVLDDVRSQQVRDFFATAHGALERMLQHTTGLLAS